MAKFLLTIGVGVFVVIGVLLNLIDFIAYLSS